LNALRLVQKAQRVQLAMGAPNFHFEERDMAREHPLSPYEGFGLVTSSYDLGAVGAVAEVKRALLALADYDRTLDQATAQMDRTSDTWTEAAAIAFATMVSRYRSSMVWGVPEPFMQTGPYPSRLQPTVNGLELLAGAINERLGKNSGSELARYEAWRGGTFKPPSVVSRPPSDTPVKPTYNFAPASFVPSDASADEAAAVADLDALLEGLQTQAMVATSEADRQELTGAFMKASSDRELAATRAIDSSEATRAAAVDCAAGSGTWESATQTCVLGPTAVKPSPTPRAAGMPVASGEGHLAAWILLGALGVGAYFYLKEKR
jgi:hypothetical protein